jgi:hypothetical protein
VTLFLFSFVLLLRWCECSCDVHLCSLHPNLTINMILFLLYRMAADALLDAWRGAALSGDAAGVDVFIYVLPLVNVSLSLPTLFRTEWRVMHS